MSSQSPTAIVTGGASGIGRAIALRLASDGFNVAICDISSQEVAMKALKAEIGAKGRKALAMVVNVSVEKEVNDFVSTVVSQFGGLDVMVANAGVAVLTSILESALSLSGKKSAALCSTYGSTKFAIRSLTQTAGESLVRYDAYTINRRILACEFGKFNITVNA
ncbi:Diacetyl reductase [(S)-acetoin forming] [Leucoagaricus sp. SymC.cos]|nr:Diacetyl reductase [(S)-acetoin forming] [Leucoagaricus sp. SymC.cos]